MNNLDNNDPDTPVIAAADKLLREAGYDPDRLRGRVSDVDLAKAVEAKRRLQWGAKNRLKGDQRQLGLAPPAAPLKPSQGGWRVGSFIAGYWFGKLF